MKIVRTLLGVAALVSPLLLVDAPAQALTSRQYRAQGYGCYISSKGSRYHCARGYHRYYRHYRHHRHHYRYGY